MKNYEHIQSIEKCKGLTRKQFIDQYVKKSLPVVVADKPQWSAFQKFTPAFFKSQYGHIERVINGKTYNFAELLDLCAASEPGNTSPYPIIFDMKVYFPELIPDIKPSSNYGKTNRLWSPLLPKLFSKRIANLNELFFGGKGCSFPVVHIDDFWVHTQLTQIFGDKEFILYAPDQKEFMYPDPNNPRMSLVNNIHEPDLEKFPLFKNAKALKVIVHPGESIYIPSGWWHTTYSHDFNLSYSTDHLNAWNWNIFMNENYKAVKINHPNLAWIVKIYTYTVGRVLSIQEFFLKP